MRIVKTNKNIPIESNSSNLKKNWEKAIGWEFFCVTVLVFQYSQFSLKINNQSEK